MESLANDILDSLDDLGYNGLFDESSITTIAQEGPCSSDYTKLISSLISELRLFYGIEEIVNPTSGTEEKENFLFELSGFLSEYGCPYKSLVSGVATDRLNNKQDCLKLILFLTSELQAAKMFFKKNPDKVTSSNQIDSVSTLIFDQLKRLCIALRMSKPPDNISLDKFFGGIQKKLSEIVASAPAGCLSEPVIKCQMGPAHWEKLEAINEALTKEYSTRRSMLLKRVDVTISSFQWSDRAKKNTDNIARAYQEKRHRMIHESSITLVHLLAARDDLSQIYKTSSGSTRHSCAINKVLMGKVPDRGGRPSEVAPPPPEMPSWQKRQDGGGRGRGQGGFRGGGGGDRGYQGQGDNRRRGNDRGGYRGGYGGNRGGYNNDRGGYNGDRGGYGNRPQSARGGSRWGRGGGNPQGGAFDQVYGYGGQGYGRGGFGSGQQTYRS